jgi:primosomal protein N' (replication factor Y)
LQTFYPDNEVILDAARQDYETFFAREIESRRQLSYPPFSRIVNFTLSSEDQNEIVRVTSAFYEQLKERMRRGKLEGQIVGPADCPLHYLRRRYRRHMFVKTNQIVKLTRMLSQWESVEANFKLPSSVRIAIDIDPQDMM